MGRTLTLAEIADAQAEGGEAAVVRLLGGAPALILRTEPWSPKSPVAEGSWSATQKLSLEATASDGVLDRPLSVIANKACPVIPLAKSERNPFVGVITLGRAPNNDVCLVSSLVSNIHAFFKDVPGRSWALQDNTSRNGTFVNNERLEPRVDRYLTRMDEVRFGDVAGMFVDPETVASLCLLVR